MNVTSKEQKAFAVAQKQHSAVPQWMYYQDHRLTFSLDKCIKKQGTWMIEYMAWSEILLFIGYEIENGSAKEDFWFQSNLFQNCFHKAGLEPQEYVYHWFLCMFDNPIHILLELATERQRERAYSGVDQFSNVDLTDSFTRPLVPNIMGWVRTSWWGKITQSPTSGIQTVWSPVERRMRKKFAQCQEREGGTISKWKLQEIKLKANEGCLQKKLQANARKNAFGKRNSFGSVHWFS